MSAFYFVPGRGWYYGTEHGCAGPYRTFAQVIRVSPFAWPAPPLPPAPIVPDVP